MDASVANTHTHKVSREHGTALRGHICTYMQLSEDSGNNEISLLHAYEDRV